MDPRYSPVEIAKPLKREFKAAAAIRGMTMRKATEIAVRDWMSYNGFSVSQP